MQPTAQETGASEPAERLVRPGNYRTVAETKPTIQKPVLQQKKAAVGSVSRFISENVSTAKDAKTEMRDLIRGYRDWCATEGLRATDLSKALDEVEALCGQIGIQIEVAPNQRVYCVGATLRGSSP